MSVQMIPFDVKTVNLHGKNLIEASAGTGKTYSLAVLVLRLLLETDLKIKELLLVTFTEAAVAELEERVRKFLIQAQKNANGFETNDLIQTIVLDAIQREDLQKVKAKIKESILLLDEVHITTIHGFCNSVQKQFAFETKQLFEKELIADENYLYEQAVNQFWRTHITLLNPIELKFLFDAKFSRSELLDAVRKSAAGYLFQATKLDCEELVASILKNNEALKQKEESVQQTLAIHKSVIEKVAAKNTNIYKLREDKEKLFEEIIKAFEAEGKIIQKLPEDLVALVYDYLDCSAEIQNSLIDLKSQYHMRCIEFALERIKNLKENQSLQSFNDMINGLHQALKGDHKEALIRQLKKKYKAVFIDEFQDTDKVQYEIFYEAFGNAAYDKWEGIYPTKVFYIGDPKQSIYAFRQANLITYNQARLVSKNYGMETNFRSIPSLIEAMNVFFAPNETYSFFQDPSIAYIPVKSADKWTINDELTQKGLDSKPITFVEYKKDEDAFLSITDQVYQLLTTGQLSGQKVLASDIGVLVKSKKQGQGIKNELAKIGIPSVLVDDSKVMLSNENQLIRFVLELILEVNRSNVNRLMLSNFTHYQESDLEQLDLAAEISRFAKVIEDYQQFGVYPALMTFIRLYDSKNALHNNVPHLASRSISNFIQIAEICNDRQVKYKEDLTGLIAWLKKENEGQEGEGAFAQRLENDQNAVNILTIHRSKGLQYKVVLVFFPSDSDSNKGEFIEYQDAAGDFNFSFKTKDSEFSELKKLQTEQENKRLWYVAVTRAEYKCFIYWKGKKVGDYMIQDLRNQLLNRSDYNNFFEDLGTDIGEMTWYRPEKEVLIREYPKPDFTIDFRSSWSVSSYSSIRNQEYHPHQNTQIDTLKAYEDFVFHQMPRGASYGSFMHQIFEEINFSESDSHLNYLKKKLKSPIAKGILTEKNLNQYAEFIGNVLGCKLEASNGEQLDLTNLGQILVELEFYFSIDQLSESEVKANFEKEVAFQFSEYKGFVNGFIDLCFEKDGKYYILDWKSNHLGDDIASYQSDVLDLAMTEHNYHLQYFIYTIALCRQLKLINPDFNYDTDFGGVFYLFVRGCRKGESSGVFYHKPSWVSVKGYL